jgi:hypothetical protein
VPPVFCNALPFPSAGNQSTSPVNTFQYDNLRGGKFNRRFENQRNSCRPVEIFSITPRFNAVASEPTERKTVSNGFFPLAYVLHPTEAGC